jgi:type VI secretion system secreted protein Hcp
MAVDYFLKIDGIPGESTDDKHKGEIEVLSLVVGRDAARVAERRLRGRSRQGADVRPHRPRALLQGQSAAAADVRHRQARQESAVLTARRSGKAQTDFLTFSLSDVLVSPYQTGGVSAEMPLDSISLSFSKIEVSYKEQKTDGSLGPAIRVGWDRKTNKQF